MANLPPPSSSRYCFTVPTRRFPSSFDKVADGCGVMNAGGDYTKAMSLCVGLCVSSYIFLFTSTASSSVYLALCPDWARVLGLRGLTTVTLNSKDDGLSSSFPWNQAPNYIFMVYWSNRSPIGSNFYFSSKFISCPGNQHA